MEQFRTNTFQALETSLRQTETEYGEIPSNVNSFTWTLKKLSRHLNTKIATYIQLIRLYTEGLETKAHLAYGAQVIQTDIQTAQFVDVCLSCQIDSTPDSFKTKLTHNRIKILPLL